MNTLEARNRLIELLDWQIESFEEFQGNEMQLLFLIKASEHLQQYLLELDIDTFGEAMRHGMSKKWSPSKVLTYAREQIKKLPTIN